MRRIMGAMAVLAGLSVVVPSAPATAAATTTTDISGLEYVALGDSYQAGFGLLPFSATEPFPGSPNGCYQADADYPHRLATGLGLALADRTCSGAVTANLGYLTPTTSLPVPATNVQTFPALSATEAKQHTMSGVNAPTFQNEALSASTDVVTVGIGGNDLGFSDITESCMRLAVGPGTKATGMEALTTFSVANCRDVFDDGSNPTYANYQMSARLSTYIAPRIDAAFAAIAAEAPNAEVFVIGYPQLTPETATDACFRASLPPSNDNVPLSGVDLMYLHQVEQSLLDIVAARADFYGFHFVSAWESTANHTLCAGADSWIEPLDIAEPVSGSCPADYLPFGSDGTIYMCIRLGALHPTEAGVANLHQLARAAIQSTFYVDVTGDPDPGGAVTISGGGFRPNEPVEVVLHSTPVTLGTFTAGASGSFSASVTIPSSVPPGAHTIVATGLTSGRTFSVALSVELPATGADSIAPPLIGLCLITSGFLLVAARRRGRKATDRD